MPLEHWLDDATDAGDRRREQSQRDRLHRSGDQDGADFDLRWFTPTSEVELCGHATLAAGHVLMTGNEVASRPSRAF